MDVCTFEERCKPLVYEEYSLRHKLGKLENGNCLPFYAGQFRFYEKERLKIMGKSDDAVFEWFEEKKKQIELLKQELFGIKRLSKKS